MALTSLLPSAPALSPVCVIPRRPSRAIEPLAFLQKIESVEINDVVERNGVVYFVLDVYLQRVTSRIPTNQIKQNASLNTSKTSKNTNKINRKPDYQLEKRFTDFADFRYQVWVNAQKNHGCKCAYCDEFMDFIVYSMAQPRLLVKIATSTNMRKKLFTTFCNEFVRLSIGKCEQAQQQRVARGLQCEGFQVIPALVERFFREQDE